MCAVVQLNQWRPRALICVICDVLMAFGPCVGPCVLQSGLPGLRFVDLSIFQARGSWWKTRPPFGSRGPSVRSNLPHREPRACQLGATVKPHSRTSKAPRELTSASRRSHGPTLQGPTRPAPRGRWRRRSRRWAGRRGRARACPCRPTRSASAAPSQSWPSRRTRTKPQGESTASNASTIRRIWRVG